MNKPGIISCLAVFREDRQWETKALSLLLGGSRLLSGGVTSRARGQHRHQRARRDSGQSRRARYDLSTAFPCGGFSLLDIGRVEPAPTRTPSLTVSAALRHVRVRV